MNAAGAKNPQQFAFRSRIELARKIAVPTNLLALNAAIEAQSFTKKRVLLGNLVVRFLR